MNSITEWTIVNLKHYGVSVLFVMTFMGSAGMPFPNTGIVMAAGAFTRMGFLDWRLAILACLLGASLADNGEYLLGHLAQPWLAKRFGQKNLWQQAQTTINKQGKWAILLTRFWIMPLAPAVNVMSGTRYPYKQFLFFDLLGQCIWIAFYGGLGYLFAPDWENINSSINLITSLSFALFILAIVSYIFTTRQKAHNPS